MKREIAYERLIAAPRERVFEAFTSPEGQREFYGQDDPNWIVESECDLRVGGTWSVLFGPARDHLYRHDHVFEAIEPPARVLIASTETRVDGSSFDTRLEYTFEDRGGRTLMRVTHSGFPTDELQREHTTGVPHTFDRLERLLGTAGVPKDQS